MVYLPDYRNPAYIGVSDDDLRARLPALRADLTNATSMAVLLARQRWKRWTLSILI